MAGTGSAQLDAMALARAQPPMQGRVSFTRAGPTGMLIFYVRTNLLAS